MRRADTVTQVKTVAREVKSSQVQSSQVKTVAREVKSSQVKSRQWQEKSSPVQSSQVKSSRVKSSRCVMSAGCVDNSVKACRVHE